MGLMNYKVIKVISWEILNDNIWIYIQTSCETRLQIVMLENVNHVASWEWKDLEFWLSRQNGK